jgi:hypothetical protein
MKVGYHLQVPAILSLIHSFHNLYHHHHREDHHRNVSVEGWKEEPKKEKNIKIKNRLTQQKKQRMKLDERNDGNEHAKLWEES